MSQDLAGKFDTIFLTTPHGLELQQRPLLYANPSVSGSASLGADVANSTRRITVPFQVARNEFLGKRSWYLHA